MVRAALKRPITILVLFTGLLLFSFMAIRTIPIDIFPKLNLPTIYVIESYGGMSPQQMEGFFATRMQDQFLYVNGIKNMESKNIQGLTLIKLTFYEKTDMAEASAQVALQVNRASKFFPPGALPPQVIRFDASSLPVGQLVFSSKEKSLKDIYDLVVTRIRPMFSTVSTKGPSNEKDAAPAPSDGLLLARSRKPWLASKSCVSARSSLSLSDILFRSKCFDNQIHPMIVSYLTGRNFTAIGTAEISKRVLAADTSRMCFAKLLGYNGAKS